MYRQSPSRNHRSKGIKVRHILQICLLLAVCFWLIYQAKHSQNKKKESDESDDEKVSLQRGASDEPLRLGRKDIRSGVEETTYKNEKHDKSFEEQEENIREEEDENKLEEDEREENKFERNEEDEREESKLERNVDEVIEGENEETDEQEQNRSDAEIDREQDFLDDGKDKEDGDENVIEETDSDTERIQIEKENSTEESYSDGVDKSVHEAREEQYKADDASSAVRQDTHEKLSNDNENEHSKGNDDEDTNKFENRKDLEVEIAKDEKNSNVTTSENKELILDNSENGSPPNGTVAQDNVTNNDSTEIVIVNSDSSLLNTTESENKLDHGPGNLNETISKEVSISDAIASEKMNVSSLNEDNNGIESNSTSKPETEDPESNSESAQEKIITSENSAETSSITLSSTGKNDEFVGERSDTNTTTDENVESTTYNENHEDVEHGDSIDISDSNNSLEETDVRTDLDTLPVTHSEGTNNDDDDAAAE